MFSCTVDEKPGAVASHLVIADLDWREDVIPAASRSARATPDLCQRWSASPAHWDHRPSGVLNQACNCALVSLRHRLGTPRLPSGREQSTASSIVTSLKKFCFCPLTTMETPSCLLRRLYTRGYRRSPNFISACSSFHDQSITLLCDTAKGCDVTGCKTIEPVRGCQVTSSCRSSPQTQLGMPHDPPA